MMPAEDPSNSGTQHILETRIAFLHQIKGLMQKNDTTTTEGKQHVGSQLCKVLFDQGLAFRFNENDMPDAQSRNLWNLFIVDAHYLASVREGFREDLRGTERYGGKEALIEGFYAEVREVTDRALLRYEQIVHLIGPKP